MSILKIARQGHPVLSKKANPVKNITGPNIKKLIHDMSETMIDAKGIGLAAPQVHVSKQIIIFRLLDENETEDDQIKITALINPKITILSKETENNWEGCLSIPGMLGLVTRYKKINYAGFDMDGNVINQNAEGLQARVIQHEFDHLMGVMYTQRLANKMAYGFVEEIEEYWKKNYEQED